MIIKSLSRKTASFDDLLTYFHKEHNAVAPTYQWNMYAQTPSAAAAEFKENAGWLAKRKNGVIMFHEIISVPKNEKIPNRRLGSILKDITHQYVQRRCPDQLVYVKRILSGTRIFICVLAPTRRAAHGGTDGQKQIYPVSNGRLKPIP